MKIGIIGCGYVGRAASLLWKKEGHTLSVTTRHPQKILTLQSYADQVYLLDADHPLTDFVIQQDVLLIAVAPDDPAHYKTAYLQTAQTVATAAAQAPHLLQIMYTSSTSVYEDFQGKWVDEETSVFPSTDNGRILSETEEVLLKCASAQRSVCIFRLGEIDGPGREIAARLRRMHHQPFPGSGETYVNLIHLETITRALDFALKQKLNGLYNLCEDFHPLRKDFYTKLCQKEGIPPIVWDPTKISAHAGNKRVSNQKLREKGFIFLSSPYV